MTFSRIIGTGSYLPARVLTNYDLEKMVETSHDWIFTRSGIVERRFTPRPVPPEQVDRRGGRGPVQIGRREVGNRLAALAGTPETDARLLHEVVQFGRIDTLQAPGQPQEARVSDQYLLEVDREGGREVVHE